MDQSQALKIIVKAQDDASATLKTIQNEAKKTGDAVNQASKDGGAAMDDFKGKIGSVVNTLKTIAVTAGIAAIGFGAAFLHSAADLQQTSQSMQVLTGDTKVANKLFGQLATYANNTPFEFPQIAKAAQTMLGFGISSDKVFTQLQMLGDISAATGADLGSLSLVFGQVNATGKLMGQDALQLINNQIPIFNILGKKMGITAGEVKQKMEDGAISADIFNAALLDVTKQGGFAFQGTSKLAETFNGRISTLKDTFLEFGRSLLGVKVTSEGLQIDPNGVFQKLSNALLSATKALQSYAPQAQKAFSWLIDHAVDIVKAVVSIAAAFAIFKIGTFVASAVAAVQAAGGLGAAMLALVGGPVGLIILAVAALVAGLVWLQLKFNIIGQAIAFLKPVIDPVVLVFKEMFRVLGELLAPAIDFVVRNMDTFKTIGLILLAVVLAPIIATVVTMIAVFALVVAAVIAIVYAFQWIYRAGIEVYNFFQALPGRILGALGFMGNLLVNAGRDVIAGLVNGIKSLAGSLWNGIAEVSGNIGRFFSGAGSWLFETGKALIWGLINGIKNVAGAVSGAIGDVANAAKDKFKSVLGIRSPSKVFAGFGMNLMKGLANGINGSTGLISNAMSSVSNAVTSGLNVAASPNIQASISGQNGQVEVTSSIGGSTAPNVTSSPDTASATGQPIVFQPTFNGPIIGNESGLRELSVTMAMMLQDALKAQGTTDINMLRST